MGSPVDEPRSLYCLPQVKGISLNRYIKVADRMPTGEVADSPSREKTGHAFRAGGIANQAQGTALRRR